MNLNIFPLFAARPMPLQKIKLQPWSNLFKFFLFSTLIVPAHANNGENRPSSIRAKIVEISSENAAILKERIKIF